MADAQTTPAPAAPAQPAAQPTVEQLQAELSNQQKRYKDLQADQTKARQELAALRQDIEFRNQSAQGPSPRPQAGLGGGYGGQPGVFPGSPVGGPYGGTYPTGEYPVGIPQDAGLPAGLGTDEYVNATQAQHLIDRRIAQAEARLAAQQREVVQRQMMLEAETRLTQMERSIPGFDRNDIAEARWRLSPEARAYYDQMPVDVSAKLIFYEQVLPQKQAAGPGVSPAQGGTPSAPPTEPPPFAEGGRNVRTDLPAELPPEGTPLTRANATQYMNVIRDRQAQRPQAKRG